MKAHLVVSENIRRFISFGLIVLIAISFILPSGGVAANSAKAFSQISFVANIETAGVVVSGVSLPGTAQLYFRRSGELDWHAAHYLMRIDDGRLVGSLFNLSQSTAYDVKVSDGAVEILGSFTTQADELAFAPTNTIYVNTNSPAGGDGSMSAPLRTIQEGVNRALPGTQVLVADGVYKESVTFPASGTAGNWIQVRAQGGGAVLDGSTSIPAEEWKQYEGKTNVWYTKISPGIKYLARDGLRFYQYDFLNDLLSERGHNNVTMHEGWYYEPVNGRLYIRADRNPSKYVWQVPQFNAAFMVDGRDWIWIEGFEMRYYGTEYGCGVCSKNSSHVVIRKNKIHHIQNPVHIEWTGGEDRGNDTRIEYNEMYDTRHGEWAWNAVKGTSMESMAIILRGHIGAIVRGNNIHHYFNGIYTSSSAALDNPGVAFDADIYNNRITSIGDDALEPEGTCVNHRFRNNVIDSTLVGISLAPVTMGPTWVLRNTFSNYSSRSLKWDKNSDGWVLVYHNTSWTNYANPNQAELISPISNSVLRNNIFQGNGYSIEARNPGALGNDWNYDNWSTSGTGFRFKWDGVDHSTMNQLCRAAGLECNGYEGAPGLSNPYGGDFSLQASSLNVDRGLLIPGINDSFLGAAPDLGAFESPYGAPPTAIATNTPSPVSTAIETLVPTSTPIFTPTPAVDVTPIVSPLVLGVFRTDPTPSNTALIHFGVLFSKDVSGVDAGDFILNASGTLTGFSITEIMGVGATYLVTVNTGTGDGTLRLDLVDNDSILDALSTPLGGLGLDNGTFTTGETYVINKNAPLLISSLRADPSPTAAESVRFTLTFSESVTGVDAADFVLITSGLSEARVSSVSGMDSVYTVTVNTGTGNGSLRLDLLDDDSILDSAGTPLGGAGAGNGLFVSGETYIIDRVTSVIQSASYPSDGAQDGWVLESKETSNKGGSMNSNSATLRVGDNAQDNQYRTILQFSTASLPDNAVITQAILTLQLETIVGVNPFSTHRNMWVDLRQGAFGSFGPFQIGALQASDFQAPASFYSAGVMTDNPVAGWYWVSLDSKALSLINLKGVTQLRLGFLLDDDDDRRDDYISFFSGNYGVTSARPQLSIKYYVP